MAENSAPERIWEYPSAMAGWAKAFCRLEKAEQIAVEYVRADLVATLTEQVERLTHERDQASAALRTVQNAAKTLASAQGGELEHLRQNATYDHRLRSEHESLLARDAQMTDALLAAEARAEAAEAELAKLREAVPVAWAVAPNGPPVRLDECPIGLFARGGEIALKSEYGSNEGRIDAYIVSSGEFFWGPAPQTIESQNATLVQPLKLVEQGVKALASAPGFLATLTDEQKEAALAYDGPDGPASAPGAVREVLTQIVEEGRALRSGGPDAMDLQDLSDALQSATELAADALSALDTEQGWRPIETAPKDGTRFLATLRRETAEDMDGRKWPRFSEVREIFYREWKSPIFNDNMPWHAGDPFDNDFASDHFGEDVPVAWLPLDRLPSPPKEGGAA